MESPFQTFGYANGEVADYRGDAFPSSFASWDGGALEMGDGATHFGFVLDGKLRVESEQGSFDVGAGMYFSVPGKARLRSEVGRGFVVSRHGYDGFFSIGGPIEETGRLRYIDGCTDSLLISPVLMGDPCLNLLHIPPHTDQSRHTHPSLRAGVVVTGAGECVTPGGRHRLERGTLFIIPADAEHSFRTEGEALRVIAWHPDSDFGPTHEDHPMVNRTILPSDL